jgi:hypothetical protein
MTDTSVVIEDKVAAAPKPAAAPSARQAVDPIVVPATPAAAPSANQAVDPIVVPATPTAQPSAGQPVDPIVVPATPAAKAPPKPLGPSPEITAAWKAKWGYSGGSKTPKGLALDDFAIRPPAAPAVPAGPEKLFRPGAGVLETTKDPQAILQKPLAAAILGRMQKRWVADRSAVTDQVSGETFTAARRKALLAATGNYYLGGEYGMRVAKNQTGPGAQRGIRLDHDASTGYLREDQDKPGVKGLLDQLLADNAALTAEEKQKAVIVNSPAVIDRLRLVNGAAAYPADVCTKSVQLAPGIHALVINRDPAGIQALKDVLPHFGATPSSFQAFKAIKNTPDHPLKLREAPLGNTAALAGLADRKALEAGFSSIPPGHPMRGIANAVVNLAAGLDACMPRPAAEIPGSADEKCKARLARLKSETAKLADARAVDALKPDFATLDGAIAGIEGQIAAGQFDAANVALGPAEAKLLDLQKARMDRDPLLNDSLGQMQVLLSVMPAMANDAPRFTQLFDLTTDELHIILSQTRPYGPNDFKQKSREQLAERAPSIKALDPTVEAKPYLVSSGMDALTTGFAAARQALGADGDAQMVNSEGTYFEQREILGHAERVRDEGRIVIGNLNPSTPTDPPSSIQSVIDAVKAKLTAPPGVFAGPVAPGEPGAVPPPPAAPKKLSLVLDITVEQGKKDAKGDIAGPSDVDKVFADPDIKRAIEAGTLSVVLCKSYQKYPTLGSGKVMAGSVTVVAKQGQFAGDDLLGRSEAGAGVGDSDEGQLMTHLVATTGKQELELGKNAADNAQRIADMMPVRGGKRLGIFNPGLPFVIAPDKPNELTDSDGRKTSQDTYKLLLAMGVESRDSFGFQNMSCLAFDGNLRINPGQESPEGLTEKFHAVNKVFLSAAADQQGYDAEFAAYQAEKERNQAEFKAAKAAWDLTDKSTQAPRLNPSRRMPVRPPSPTFNLAAVKGSMTSDVDTAIGGLPAEPGGAPWPTDLAGKIKKLGGKFKPAIAKRTDDPAAMLGGVTYGADAEKLGTINSKIASHLLLAKAAFSATPADKAEVCNLHEAFFEGGMHKVTPETKARLLSNWMELSLNTGNTTEAVADRKDPAKANSLAAKVGKFAALMPYREDKAKAFLTAIPEKNFGELPAPARKTITGALFGGLDVQSKLNIVEKLVADRNFEKAKACLDDFEGFLDNYRKGLTDAVSPDTLISGPLEPGGPEPLSVPELARISGRLKELRATPGIAETPQKATAAPGVEPPKDVKPGTTQTS